MTSHFRHTTSHSGFAVTLPVFEKLQEYRHIFGSTQYFQKCDDIPGISYKCDDFVILSHHFSGFGLEQTWV